MRPALSVVCFLSETSMEKINFAFVTSYGLEIASMLGTMCPFLFSTLGPHLGQTCVGPVHAATIAGSSEVCQLFCV